VVAKNGGHSVDTVLVKGSSPKIRIIPLPYLAAKLDDAVGRDPHGLTDYDSLEKCSSVVVFRLSVCQMWANVHTL
jgi:hypothetical protein